MLFRQWPIERRLCFGFGLALLLLVLISLTIYRAALGFIAANRWVVHTHEVQQELQAILSGVQDAETAQRGFLLTGSEVYLLPYRQALPSLPPHLQHLQSLTADNPQQQRQLPALQQSISAKIAGLKQTVELKRANREHDARQIVLSGRGRGQMEVIRQQIAAMEATEERLLKQRSRTATTDARRLLFILGGILLLLFALLTSLFALLRRYIADRRRAEVTLQASEHRYHTLFQAIDEGFCVIEVLFDAGKKPVDYRFLEINPAFEAQSGLHDAVGKRIQELQPDIETHWFDIYGQVVLTGEPIRFINEARALGERWFDVYAFQLEGRESAKVAVLFRNITARKHAECRLSEHAEEINVLNTRLKRAMTETHHRVKNNLQLIAALIDMQQGSGTATVPMTEFARLGVNVQALGIIHDILTQEAKAGNDQETLPFRAVLAQLLHVLQQTTGGRSLKFGIDEVRLVSRQASTLALVTNELVSNALKHGRGETEIYFRVHEDTATLEVCDEGPGFPAGFNAENAANTGLELVENIVRWDLQGAVSYGNRLEGGARTCVTFPLPTQTERV